MEVAQIKQSLINSFLNGYPDEGAEILNNASNSEILNYLQNIPVSTAKEVFTKFEPSVASRVLSAMDDSYFSELFANIDSYKGALILSRLSKEKAEQKLQLLPDKVSKEIKELMTYPVDSAGYIMDTNVLTFYANSAVRDVLKRLRQLNDRRIITIYIIDREGHLEGKVPLQRIAISRPQETLQELIEESKAVFVMSHKEEIVEIFKKNNLFNVPVVDIENKLLGIIRHDALIEATQQDATEDVQAMFGAGREERALSKVGFAVKKRLPWLQINLATAFLAAAVVGIFEDTIARITVLAVFLPVVAGQSGNTGSQALAVVMRGLALREFRSSQWLKVAKKEAVVGFINGVAVALTTSIIVYFWASSFGLALIIAVSMVVSMIIAGFSGAVIPIILKSLGQDPAQSSSIVLTTVTDIVGFMSFLGLATALASVLGVI